MSEREHEPDAAVPVKNPAGVAPNPGRNLPSEGLTPEQVINHDQQNRTNEDLDADRM